MTLRNQLLQNPFLEYQNNIFYQKGIQRNNSFEEAYLKLREKEHRLHSDDVVKNLPEFKGNHPNSNEWKMRKSSLHILIKHLKASGSSNILELGCGNGWLSYNLATSMKAQICAMDINETELLQGVRIFGNQENLCFVYADIFSSVLNSQKFHAIVLGGSVQYFCDLEKLFTNLFEMIDSTGTIYIVDSPFYSSPSESNSAAIRSQKYFNSLGFPEMTAQYFHHTLAELSRFNYTMLYNPKSVSSLIRRKLLRIPLSVFPIFGIKN